MTLMVLNRNSCNFDPYQKLKITKIKIVKTHFACHNFRHKIEIGFGRKLTSGLVTIITSKTKAKDKIYLKFDYEEVQ